MKKRLHKAERKGQFKFDQVLANGKSYGLGIEAVKKDDAEA